MATQTGYGLTKKGGSNPAVRDGAIELFKIFNSEDRAMSTDIVDAFLAGTPNDLLNEGLKKLITGKITPKGGRGRKKPAVVNMTYRCHR